ncbi:Eisosome assembly protein [Podospora pseudoanserina]|uniref:Eisosome assembly protein n=1 Tax=Podospora pseudoanserina TaxID=2609844 RepID=A0ABR0IHP2_9PEZI|nr:Eisosome assembly protein [Podospora pseudoanserina]
MVSASLTTHGVAPRPIAPNNTGRLRYANAEDLPGYPSAGLTEGSAAAASAAATLGWANRKPTEVWKPNSNITSTSASTAALLAAGNKTSPVGRENQPVGTAGSQAAVAASSAQRQPKAPSSPPSQWVSSAANLAFSANKPPPPPAITVSNAAGTTPEPATLGRQNSLRAAKGAMAGLRPRAKSTPQPVVQETYPDQANSASNALSAATIAHRPTLSETGGAVPFTTMDRRMFTSNPPVRREVEEKQRADVLHASAVAMAKRMYNQQQRRTEESTKAHARSSSFPRHGPNRPLDADEEPPVMHNNLQEAAYRLAQERLAKLQEEHQKNRNMSDYYGTPGGPSRTKFGTIRGRLTRKRSSSDGDLLEDQRRSQHIRKQMSMLNSKLSEVDEEKRAKDRQALLAAAQRNVRAQLHDMDEKVLAEKGGIKAKPMGDWERKALIAAQTRFDENNTSYHSGKIDIGGGKFMDQSEVDAIAARKVQPLLDEINERAEREQARLEEERLEEERRREEAERERLREKEVQDIHKKLKDQQKEDEKARKAELKEENKRRKEEIKAIKQEHKLAAMEGKQKEKEVIGPPPAVDTEETAVEPVAEPSPETEDKQPTTAHRHALSISFPRRKKITKETPSSPEKSPKSEGESHGKVRTWLLSRLPRPRAKSSSAAEGPNDPSTAKKGAFIGGAALARLVHNNSSSPSVAGSQPQAAINRPSTSGADNLGTSSSLHEVAMAGRPQPHDEPGEASGLNPPPPAIVRPVTPARTISQVSVPVSDVSERTVSSLSSSDDGHTVDKFVEARSQLGSPLTPPRTLGGRLGVPVAGSNGRSSPLGRESRFSENLSE